MLSSLTCSSFCKTKKMGKFIKKLSFKLACLCERNDVRIKLVYIPCLLVEFCICNGIFTVYYVFARLVLFLCWWKRQVNQIIQLFHVFVSFVAQDKTGHETEERTQHEISKNTKKTERGKIYKNTPKKIV